MMRLLFLFFLSWSYLAAYTTIENEPPVYIDPAEDEIPLYNVDEELRGEDSVEQPKPTERLIYLTIEKVPKKIYVGQIFPVTIKITSLKKHLPYLIELEGGRNIKAIREYEYIRPHAINHLTYYFKATGSAIKLPAFVVHYEDSDRVYRTESITLNAVRLNPPKDFSGILAKKMELINYQASSYEEGDNILALQMLIAYGNTDDFRLPHARKQGIDSMEGDLNATTLLYYAVYPSDIEQIEFSYFNVTKNRYERFQVPIIVKRSSVSTQSNLDPQASEFTKFKIAATATLMLIWLILWIRRKGWIYPILIGLAGAYLVTYLIPLKSVCIKPETTIYLLPTEQSTPFMRLYQETTAKEMNHNSRYTKIQLPNNRIGWVKNEDLCSY
ncbi:hypothetical protein [Hydrogenimonas sp.]|uniref:hypothetical protein n=1 Tax=Hydrogenimonas sp. TaxID=2231112 RepID=UPI00261C989F|nr:hypothetical protein [Hydrogenimonas sp.]